MSTHYSSNNSLSSNETALTKNNTLQSHSITWDELDAFQFTIYGSLYIFITDIILYPADLLTTKLQADKFTNQKGIKIRKLASSILKREGLKGLFRGFVPATVGSFPGQYLYYISYEWVNQQALNLFKRAHLRLDAQNEDGSMDRILSNCIAGLSAEIISGIAFLPTDIISQRLQVERNVNFLHFKYKFDGSKDIIWHIWKHEGIKGFYRGYIPYIIVFGPQSALWWSGYEASKRIMFTGLNALESALNNFRNFFYLRYDVRQKKQISKSSPTSLLFGTDSRTSFIGPIDSIGIEETSHHHATGSSNGRMKEFILPAKKEINHIISGAMSGILSCFITNPLDVARTRLQLLEASHPNEKQAIAKGFVKLLRTIYNQEGIQGWYKGIKPRVMIRIPGSAIAFLGYEWLKEASTKNNASIRAIGNPQLE